MTLDEMEGAARERIAALPPAARAELLYVLRLPDFERAGRIGDCWANPSTRSFAELLIDIEEEPALRAVLVGILAERGRC